MRAAKDLPAPLDAMAEDLAPAMRAHRRDGVNRAFKGIKGVSSPGDGDPKGLVVFVAANFAFHSTMGFGERDAPSFRGGAD